MFFLEFPYSESMEIIQTKRPRNLDVPRAAGILYGDLGTNKAYVLGLAFALASYSSFWYILAVSLLTVVIGINYIKICSFYPNGGGVYTSVRNRSKTLSRVGAFFIISDYIITAAIGAVSAFHYLGVPHVEVCAIVAVIVIGTLNFLGPRHAGTLSIWLAVPTVSVVVMLFLMSLSFLPHAIERLEPPTSDLIVDWKIFVGIIVALSGIESIANTTGSMQLDSGSTRANPSVVKTSTPAIIMVILEVSFFTAFLGLAMNALPGLEIHNGEVSAPGYPNVRDAMLRYMGEIFSGSMFGQTFGYWFSLIVSGVFALLLLSSVNTAIIALISLFFIMSSDRELPRFFQKLNRFGVPHYATLVAFLLPVGILFVVSDVAGLANLYAIGFVGAIAINLGGTSTNFALPLKTWERLLMFFTCLVMLCIEITLFIDKPEARIFVMAVTGIGFCLHAIASRQKEKIPVAKATPIPLPQLSGNEKEPMIVAVTEWNKSIDFALEEAQKQNKSLYILFIREQRIVTQKDNERLWSEDKGACKVINYVMAKSTPVPLGFLYTISADTVHSIIEIAKMKQAGVVVFERKRSLINTLRGTTIKNLKKYLPSTIKLIVVKH
jgi:amino acid transporter